jgi:hypothetical protein
MKDFDATAPNVMQSLVYWTACSMGLVGAEHPIETRTEGGVPDEVSVPTAGRAPSV